jgi:hypothetical protein
MLDRTSKLKTYRFDQMAEQINDRVANPAESGVERYVGLEHLDADSLRIRRWGDITDVESTCARHDAQAAVPGEAWGMMVRRYRTEGRRRQGKGMTRKWGV